MSLSHCWSRSIRFTILLAPLLQFSTNTILWRCVLYMFDSFICMCVCVLYHQCFSKYLLFFLDCLPPRTMSYLLNLLFFIWKCHWAPAQMEPPPLVRLGGGWVHEFNTYRVHAFPVTAKLITIKAIGFKSKTPFNKYRFLNRCGDLNYHQTIFGYWQSSLISFTFLYYLICTKFHAD